MEIALAGVMAFGILIAVFFIARFLLERRIVSRVFRKLFEFFTTTARPVMKYPATGLYTDHENFYVNTNELEDVYFAEDEFPDVSGISRWKTFGKGKKVHSNDFSLLLPRISNSLLFEVVFEWMEYDLDHDLGRNYTLLDRIHHIAMFQAAPEGIPSFPCTEGQGIFWETADGEKFLPAWKGFSDMKAGKAQASKYFDVSPSDLTPSAPQGIRDNLTIEKAKSDLVALDLGYHIIHKEMNANLLMNGVLLKKTFNITPYEAVDFGIRQYLPPTPLSSSTARMVRGFGGIPPITELTPWNIRQFRKFLNVVETEELTIDDAGYVTTLLSMFQETSIAENRLRFQKDPRGIKKAHQKLWKDFWNEIDQTLLAM